MWVVLYTDVVMWLLAALLLGTAWYVSRVPDLRAKWKVHLGFLGKRLKT